MSVNNYKFTDAATAQVYPTHATDRITVVADEEELQYLKIYDILGNNVTHMVQQIERDDSTAIIDVSNLKKGVYIVKTYTTAHKIYKE